MFINKFGFQFYRSPDDGAGAGGAGGAGGVKDPAAAGGDKSAAGDAGAGDKAAADNVAAAAAKGATGDKGGDAAAGDKGGADGAAKPSWPDDWRQKGMVEAGLAADDDKTLTMLKRFTSPGDIIKKMLEQEKLIRGGEAKKGITKDSTPEQIAAYRKENNIPESFEKYDLALPDGLVVGDADRPVLNGMLSIMHEMNMNNDDTKKLMTAYFAKQKEFVLEGDAMRSKFEKEEDNKLHESWGKDYASFNNSADNLVNTFSDATRKALAGAFDSNGMPLLKNSDIRRDFAIKQQQINPHDHVVLPSGTNQGSSVADELASINKLMADKTSAYWKGPIVNGKDTALQARWLELTKWTEAQKTKK